MERYRNKTIIITGSTSGIGKGIARRIASEGGNVIVNSYQDYENISEILEEITEHGGEARFIRADIGNTGEVWDLIKKSVAHFGRVDGLINNAGIQIRSPFLEVKEEDFDRVLAVNLKGAYFATQAFAAYAIREKIKAVIVNNSSVHEELPFPNFDSYAISKGGLQMMMRNLAVELAPHGIRINNIAPGAIQTDINHNLMGDNQLMKRLYGNISMARMGTVDEVAALVAFLASDEASYITGATYLVDGGLMFHYTEQ